MTVPGNTIVLRPMRPDDIEDVARIERQSFSTSWTAQAYLNELANPVALYLVASIGETLVGFAGFHRVVDEAHVTNIAVDPGWRGQRLGDRLLCGMLLLAREHGATRATLEVRARNTVARNLYARYGFVEAAVRKNYYADTGEDAQILWIYDLFDPTWSAAFDERRKSLGL